MGIKFLKFSSLLLLLFSLTACPGGEEDCLDLGSIARVDDLIKITPLKPIYAVGETISFKLEIPSTNNYFGEQIDLFQKTGAVNARLVTGFDSLFQGNILTFISGSQANNSNWFNMIYNTNSNFYNLEINIKLNKIGNYVIFTDDSVEFQGSSKCNRYRLDTNVEGWDSEGKIYFTVE